MIEPDPGRIHLASAGEAGSVVFALHGIGGASDSFAEQLAGLSDRHRVIAWDAPGYGRSADTPTALDMDGFAGAAATVIGSLGVARVHVMGVSWGGVIATRLALTHPQLVRSLVLADSSRGSGRSPEAAESMRARIRELGRLGPTDFARVRTPRLFAPGADPQLVARARLTMAASVRLPGYRDAAESMARTDHSDALAQLAVPALVLVGEHDVVTGVAESEALARGISGARLVVLPDCGHAANQERPVRFNQEVIDFLSAFDSPPSAVTQLEERSWI